MFPQFSAIFYDGFDSRQLHRKLLVEDHDVVPFQLCRVIADGERPHRGVPP